MPLWVKRYDSEYSGNSYKSVSKAWVKTVDRDEADILQINAWKRIKKIWVKAAAGWSLFWPQNGPVPEETPYVTISSSTFPDPSSHQVELTAYVYHYDFVTSVTLEYKWQSASSINGPWTDLPGYETYQTYLPGNPSSGNYNTVSISPSIEDYPSGVSYFKFVIRGTDAVGTSTYDVMSDSITVDAPTWNTQPSFSGVYSSGQTITWNAGTAYIGNSSDGVGYMTTIYKTNNGGLTKTYIHGTSTNPDFVFTDDYNYQINLVEADIGYTYYASTYAIFSDGSGPKLSAQASTTISANKTIYGAPGAFSITSATQGLYDGSTRPISINWTTSANATSYEFEIDSSNDLSSWTSYATYGAAGAYYPDTSKTFNFSTNARYWRITMRSTNDSGLYAYTSTVYATGQAPTSPTITSATSTTTSVTINFTEPSSTGSAGSVYYSYAYKTTGSSSWGGYVFAGYAPLTSFTVNNLSSNQSYDFKMKATNFDLLSSSDSNTYTISTKIAPGPLTNVFSKTFDSGYITTFFTTGTNTSNVNIDYLFFQTQPPIGDSQNFDVSVSSSSPYYATNTTALSYPDEAYNVTLVSSNSGGISTNYGNVFFVYPNGSDKPTSTTPTFSSVTGSGFTANFSLSGSVNKAVIDLKTGGSSVSGYPKTIDVSAGANTYAIPETLTRSTSYTFYVTPRYTDTTYTSFTYNGAQKSASITTSYKFNMGDSVYISTNGYVGLTSGSTGHSSVPTTGYNAIIYLADLVQYQTAGGDGSGLLYKWSNTTQYSLKWSGYLYGYENLAAYRVTYQINFYTDQNYYDVKFIHVGSNVVSTDTQNANPGFYYNGLLVGNSIPGPYVLSTGNTYRFYYNGALPTSGIAFTEITQGLMQDAGAVTNGSADSGYTAITTESGVGYPAPIAPTSLSATTNSSSHTQLTWSGGTANYYEFFYGSQNTSVPSTTADFGTDGLITTSPYNHAAPRGYDYYYFVRSVSGTTTSNVTSGWYPTAAPGVKGHRLLYPPPTPNTPTSSGITATNITVSWTAGTNGTYNDTATTYQIYTNTTGTAPTSGTAGTDATSPKSYTYTASSTPSTQYFWVRGVNEGGASAWSSVLSATPTAEYTITYDGNGNTGGSTSPTKGNGTVTLASNGFTKTGYTFSGWNTNSSGTGTNYSAGASYTLSANVTLYAKWTVSSVAPTITDAQISPASGTAGSTEFTASGTVAGTPTPTVSYQWQYFSSSSFSYVNISGATSAKYTPPANFNIAYPNYGFYCLITATNSAGTATARPSATLNTPPPTTPGTPTLVYSRSTATVWWYTASWGASTGPGTITYSISAEGSGGGTATRGPFSSNSSGGEFSLPKSGGTLWRIKVSATNAGGTSSYSEWSNWA